MAHVNYLTDVSWDSAMKDVGFADAQLSILGGLAVSGIKVTTGAPAATVGQWARGAIVQNIVDGSAYIMTGTTASPVWKTITHA